MLSRNIAEMKSLAKAHVEADAVVAGTYWEASNNAAGGRGCFIGCLVHSHEAAGVANKFGLPEPSVRIAEAIFERLPKSEWPRFFEAVPDAIGRDGKDLSRVHWAFLADVLRHLLPQTGEVKDAVDRVITGMDTLASGGVWLDAAHAAHAAHAADAAARAAARVAARVAHAADTADAETCRQRDVFLRLLNEAA